MDLRVSDIDFASFYDFDILIWNCAEGVVFFVFHFMFSIKPHLLVK
jgi:hypothetical protein